MHFLSHQICVTLLAAVASAVPVSNPQLELSDLTGKDLLTNGCGSFGCNAVRFKRSPVIPLKKLPKPFPIIPIPIPIII